MTLESLQWAQYISLSHATCFSLKNKGEVGVVGLGLKGPCVFKFVLLSFYLWQMINVSEPAGGPQEGVEGQMEKSYPCLAAPAQFCSTETSNLPADMGESPVRVNCPRWPADTWAIIRSDCCCKPLGFQLICHIAIANLNNANDKSLEDSKDSSISP